MCPPAQAAVCWGCPWGRCAAASRLLLLLTLHLWGSHRLCVPENQEGGREKIKKWLYKGTKGGNGPRQQQGKGRAGGGLALPRCLGRC